MVDRLEPYEAALRRLPDAHSLALRLQKAGVAEEVISQYLQIEPEGLDTLFLLARQKLADELVKINQESGAHTGLGRDRG